MRRVDQNAIVRRIVGGWLYEASFPDEFFDTTDVTNWSGYYFRRVRPSGKKWWQFWKPEYVRTGDIWETDDETLFDVL